MNMYFRLFLTALLATGSASGSWAADRSSQLIGTWSGKATGAQGGPPTGDIVVTFKKAGGALEGTIAVKAPGGAQYSGQVSKIELKDRIFSATAVFKFSENVLEARVTGPLKGKTISGTFAVTSRAQKMGDGTFSITKSTGPKPPSK